MDFSNSPSEITGRMLPAESLMFGRGAVKQLDHRADWGNDMKNVQMLSCIELNDWIIIYPFSKKNAALQFVQMYSQVISSMGMQQ